jgi:concanavalin A-like lectin/glucanase superfamily protein
VVSRTFDANAANFLTVGDKAEIDITGNLITVAAWIKTNSVSTEQGIATKWGAVGANQQYELELSATGKVSFGVVNATPLGTIVTGATTVALGAWQHAAGRQTATDVFVYLNGVQDGTSATDRSIQNTATDLLIGKFVTGVAFNGLIAELGIWNIDLTPAEIAQLASGVSPALVQPGNLRGYWPLCGVGSPEPDLKSGNQAAISGTVPAGAHAPGSFPCETAGVGKAGWPRMIR